MTQCRRVASDVWLGFARCAGETPMVERERRWAADREAADRALAAVLEASGLGRDGCATSRSHTHGLAAAVAAPAGVAIGVDLVEVARVSRRHAEAILTGDEWGVLAPYAAVRPALGWALKEAAAKACGDPSRCFPLGLRITAAAVGFTVEALGSGRPGFRAGWGLLGGFLYAWVRGVAERGWPIDGPRLAPGSSGRRSEKARRPETVTYRASVPASLPQNARVCREKR